MCQFLSICHHILFFSCLYIKLLLSITPISYAGRFWLLHFCNAWTSRSKEAKPVCVRNNCLTVLTLPYFPSLVLGGTVKKGWAQGTGHTNLQGHAGMPLAQKACWFHKKQTYAGAQKGIMKACLMPRTCACQVPNNEGRPDAKDMPDAMDMPHVPVAHTHQ